MEFVSQLSGSSLAGLGSTVAIVAAAVMYVVKFQASFTDRLERQGERDEAKINDLGAKLDEERRLRRNAEERAARAVFRMLQAGIEFNESQEIPE